MFLLCILYFCACFLVFYAVWHWLQWCSSFLETFSSSNLSSCFKIRFSLLLMLWNWWLTLCLMAADQPPSITWITHHIYTFCTENTFLFQNDVYCNFCWVNLGTFISARCFKRGICLLTAVVWTFAEQLQDNSDVTCDMICTYPRFSASKHEPWAVRPGRTVSPHPGRHLQGFWEHSCLQYRQNTIKHELHHIQWYVSDCKNANTCHDTAAGTKTFGINHWR